LPAEEVRLLMAAVATRRKNMKTIMMRRKVRLPVIRTTGRKKTTMRAMTKTSTKMKMTMASVRILLPVAVNQFAVNPVAVLPVATPPVAIRPVAACPVAACPVAENQAGALPVAANQAVAHPAAAAPAAPVLRAADVPIHPGDEPSPATPAANSPAVADVQAMEAGPADNVSDT
jgi:hypothetical protein